MNFDLKAWTESNHFVWSEITGATTGALVCRFGLITTADRGRLIAVACADEPSDDEPFDIVLSIARVSLRRSRLVGGVYAFEFDPLHLFSVAILMRPCVDLPYTVARIPWRAEHCRYVWRDRRKQAMVSHA